MFIDKHSVDGFTLSDYVKTKIGQEVHVIKRYVGYSMTEAKKLFKQFCKEAKQLKITKPNGKIVYRENLEGLLNSYKSKGWKVEEV